jgi:DNA repair exonuclease SbcCD nuclease subunit
MKVVLIGDLQLHIWEHYPETDAHGVNLRLLDVISELDRIRALCVKNKVEAVCVLGDIFEARNALNINVLNHAYRAFRRFVKAGVRVILLVGNHDRTDVGPENALTVFSSFCDVVDRPKRLSLRDGWITAVPFHPDPVKVQAAIAAHVTPEDKLLLLHTAIQGIALPGGKIWQEGIPLDAIPTGPITVMGHWHRWRQLRADVYYAGSLLPVDRNDKGIIKYFGVYDSASHTVEFFPSRGPAFVDVDVRFLPEVNLPAGRFTHEEFVETYGKVVHGNFVTVTGLPPDWHDLGSIETALYGLGARHVEVAFHTQMPFTPPERITQAAALPAAKEAIEAYVEATETDLDKDALVTHGMAIVEQVMQEDTEDGMIVEVQ